MSPPSLRTIGIFLTELICCSAMAAGLQVASGAYGAEFAAYPDEPAHVVTGIMVDQYFRHPDAWLSPVRFAENYYVHYPKVAIGHWPPLLYVIQACATLIFGLSRTVILLVQALLAGLLGTMLFRVLKEQSGTTMAIAGTAGMLVVRVIQTHTSMAMAEILLTLTIFLACLAFARFVETGSWADGMWFAFWSSAAIMTKGTGWALAIVPPVTICLTRRWNLLKNPAFWCSAIMTAVLVLPWQLATLHLASVGWDDSSPSLQYSLRAARELVALMFFAAGAAVCVLALVGALAAGIRLRRENPVNAVAATLTALCFATWLFHVVVPAGAEIRKVIIAIPALFILAAFGAEAIGTVTLPRRRAAVAFAVFGGACAVGIVMSLPVSQKPRYGYIDAARALPAIMPEGSAILSASDSYGEGALISEFALVNPNPDRYIVRTSKFLTESAWNGANYRLLAANQEECGRLLAAVPVSFIMFDQRPGAGNSDHALLQSYLDGHSAGWRRLRGFESSSGGLTLYGAAGGALPVQHLVVDLKYMMGRDLAAGPVSP